ncbi:unnamed protein product, partial [marine sediment metagenome]
FKIRVDQLTEGALKDLLKEVCSGGYADDDEFDLFVKDRSLGVILAVRDTIFSDWWKSHQLPRLLWVLKEEINIKVLEFQGRYTLDEGLKWMLIYGTKGPDEEALVRKALQKM